MPFPAFSPRRLTGAAALACAAALMPMTSLVATASPAAAAAATGPPAVPASFQPASASFVSPASGYVLGAVGCTLGHVCSARLVSTPSRRRRVQARVAELAAQIDADYAGREILLVGVLKGAVMVMADLARAMRLPVQMDWMAVSSYGSGTRSSGVVRILKDLDAD